MILNLSHRPLISPLFYARNLNTVDLWQRALPATSTSEKILKFLRQMLRTILCLFWSDSEVKVYCLDPIDKQPSSLNWQVFIWACFFGLLVSICRWRKKVQLEPQELRKFHPRAASYPSYRAPGTHLQGRTPLASTVPTYGWVRNKIAVLPMETDDNFPDAMFNSQQRLWADGGILTKGYQLNFSMFPQLLLW